jgi:hypothetical protein
MSELRTKLMSREAARLMTDAEYLRGSLHSESHGAYLLDLLALEILLKCCVVLKTGKLERGHDYVHIFLRLDAETRKGLIDAAATRMGPSADYSDAYWLLSLFGANFIRLRYPYEAYGGMSEADYSRLGSEWIERGAKVDEATFDLRPNELRGLLFALAKFTDAATRWLALRSTGRPVRVFFLELAAAERRSRVAKRQFNKICNP